MFIGLPRAQISHARFSVMFSVLLYATCNAINIEKLTRWFTGPAGLDYISLAAYLIAGLSLFLAFFVASAHAKTVKPMAISLVVLSAVATYFISKYDVAIDRSMVMNTIHTDPVEIGQLMSVQMLPYAVFLMVAPVLIILTLSITFEPAGKYLLTSLKIVATTLLFAIACLYANYNAIHRAGNVSNKYIVYSLVPINIISSTVSVLSKSVRPLLARGKKDIEIVGSVMSPDDLVVVLAIGESSRRKSFSLYGYDRQKTNPMLEQVAGLHRLNGVASRGTTLYALPQILEKNGITLPTVTSKLGIPTACLVNYTLYDNCTSVGEIQVRNCNHGGKCFDEDVIPLLENSVDRYRSGKRLMVLHLGGGSHGPTYSDRHPPEFNVFKPTCDDADVANQCTAEQVYNSYDNTILYVDFVLGGIIKTLERRKVPYVFIYLSDHGESLLEEGRMFHGMPPGVTLPREQADIPLLVKASIPISIEKRDAYSQPDVYDTVLDLLSVQSPMIDTAGSFIKRSVLEDGER
jgi:lipid A ethanolaminephosphotransferase